MNNKAPTCRLRLSRPSLLAAGMMLASTLHAQEARYSLSLPAQSLGSALNALAGQTGSRILFATDSAEGPQAPALRGEMSVEQALQRLLQGLVLNVEKTPDGSYVIAEPMTYGTALELGGISISGKAPGSITEGTGSHTTGSTSSSTRLNLTPRETPQSITVLTRQRMEDQKLDNLVDALDATTGVIVKTFSQGADAPQIWARGSTINNFQIDGVPSSASLANYLQSTTAYDRIEVVRGATGMMSGMGSPSATVNLIRKRPTFEPQTILSVEAGTWDRYGTGFDTSGPLSESGHIRGRLAADYKSQHGWTDNYEQENTAIYGVTEMDLSDETLLTVGFNHLKRHTDSQTRLFPILDAAGNKIATDETDNDSPGWAYYDHELNSVFASIEQQLANGWSLKSELSHTHYRSDALVAALQGSVNQEGSGARIQSNHYAGTAEQESLDTYVTGPFSLLGREHELIGGFTLSQTESSSPNYTQHSPIYYIPNVFIWAKDSPAPSFNKTGTVKTHEYQYSAYLSSRFSLTDSTRLIMGTRVTDWKLNRDTASYSTGSKSKTRSRESGVFIPYIGVTQSLSDNWTAYASYTKIFNPQLYYVRDIDDQPLPPEEGTSYEAGIKASFMDGDVNSSLAIFKTEQDNLGVWDAGTRSYTLENGTDTQGVELDFNGKLASGWNLSSGYTYSVTRDSNDERIVTRAPRHSFKAFTTYRLSGELDRFTIGGGVNWESKTGTTLKTHTQDPYALFSLMGRYEITQNLTASVNVSNLFNKEYIVADNGLYGVYGTPRNVMTALKYSF